MQIRLHSLSSGVPSFSCSSGAAVRRRAAVRHHASLHFFLASLIKRSSSIHVQLLSHIPLASCTLRSSIHVHFFLLLLLLLLIAARVFVMLRSILNLVHQIFVHPSPRVYSYHQSHVCSHIFSIV
jgi:hypothetical protein